MNKLLSVVMPVYGKNEQIVKRSINSAIEFKKKYKDLIELIVVYKNDEINYDWLIDYKENFDLLIKAQSTFKKNKKLLEGVSKANGKYIFFLDSDDIIQSSEEVYNFIINLKTIDDDLLIIDHFISNEDNINEKKYTKSVQFNQNLIGSDLGNSTLIYKSTSKIKEILSEIPDYVPAQDLVISILMLNSTNKISNYKVCLVNYIVYKVSDSHGPQTINNLNQLVEQFEFCSKKINLDNSFSINKWNKKMISRHMLVIYLIIQNLSLITGQNVLKTREKIKVNKLSLKTKLVIYSSYYLLIKSKLIFKITSRIVKKVFKIK